MFPYKQSGDQKNLATDHYKQTAPLPVKNDSSLTCLDLLSRPEWPNLAETNSSYYMIERYPSNVSRLLEHKFVAFDLSVVT